MKHIVFLTINDINSIDESTIYNDLVYGLMLEEYKITIISPTIISSPEEIIISEQLRILKPKILNYRTRNLFKKGLSLITLDNSFIKIAKKYLKNETIDLILYATPPITLIKTISYLKNSKNAKTYLLLKDIFPQNAVDIGMMKKGSLLYRFFRSKEKKMYDISDKIGCMSPNNLEYILKNNPEISHSKIEVNPNTIDIDRNKISTITDQDIRVKYRLPKDKVIYAYGGNLGKPQGVNFLLDIMKLTPKESHFLIVGDGTEYESINRFVMENEIENITIMRKIPVSEYLNLLGACDVGIILLDRRFTIPNFPSRILSYMLCKLPILAITDASTDIGSIIESNKLGYWSMHGDTVNTMNNISKLMDKNSRIEMGKKSYEYLQNNYQISISVGKIINFMEDTNV